METLPPACIQAECPPPSRLLGWAAELWPGMAGAKAQLVPQEEPQLLFGEGGGATLRFYQAAQVRGAVFDDKGLPMGRARVVAILPASIPGLSPKSFETATDPDGAFSLRLPVPRRPMEQPYNVWVGFDDAKAAERPPLWRTGVVISGDTQIALQAKKPAELAVVRGRILDVLGNGVGGMRVQVLDGRREVISSTAVTLEEPADPQLVGTFRVLVDPGLTADSRLQLVAWPQAPDLPILIWPLSRPLPDTSHSAELRLPAYRRPLPFTLIVGGKGTSGATEKVAGARVRAQVLLEEGPQTAIYVTSGDTDGQGQVTLPLVPATTSNLEYTVTVQSPAGSPFASDVLSLQVGRDGGYISVSLPLRTRLTGKLVGADGTPVAAAQIVARDISQAAQAVSLVGRAFLEAVTPQTMTGPDGSFALRLDQGDYDLDILPPAGTHPRAALTNQRVLTDDIELGFVRLPRPTLGRVQVLGPDGHPMSGAIVRVFQLPDTTPRAGYACAELLPCSRQASLRGEATTDSRGRARFLLPDMP